MNGPFGRTLKTGVLVFLLCVSLVAGGCEGTDTRDKVDDTVEEMAGKKNVDRYKKMKEDLGDIQTQQTENYQQLDEAVDDK
jgi:hypothetical protein